MWNWAGWTARGVDGDAELLLDDPRTVGRRLGRRERLAGRRPRVRAARVEIDQIRKGAQSQSREDGYGPPKSPDDWEVYDNQLRGAGHT